MRIRLALPCLLFAILTACSGNAAKNQAANAPITVAVSPASASLAFGASLQFRATVTGTSNTSVTWKATGGSITADGAFTAGSQAGDFQVTAASAAAPQSSASAKVTVTDPGPPPAQPAIAISPAFVSVQAGATQQFTATVSGLSSTAVLWQAAGGTIDANGLFTAGAQTGAATVTATSQADASLSATAQVTITAVPSAPAPAPRLFTSSGAAWLYSPPSGQGLDISSTLVADNLGFSLNTVQGFGYPVEYTDGSYGCTTFTDTRYYNYTDKICVPNPPNGYWPTLGCCNGTSNDGHLIVVNSKTLDYYDFWKLFTDGNGHPTSTNVGKIVSGNLATSDGTPGTTAALVTGLAGDVMPGELDCEDCLQHALNVIVPGSMNSPLLGHQGPPNTWMDGSVQGGIFREGAKIRFDPSVNVDSLPASTAVRAIMKALQKYGGLITDQTGANAICIYSDLKQQPDMTGQDLIKQHLWIYY